MFLQAALTTNLGFAVASDTQAENTKQVRLRGIRVWKRQSTDHATHPTTGSADLIPTVA